MRGHHLRPPEQIAAHREVELALRDGRLHKEPCFVCKLTDVITTKVDAHHTDYARPLLVLWMCRKHHRTYHAIADKRDALLPPPHIPDNREQIGSLVLAALRDAGSLPSHPPCPAPSQAARPSPMVLDLHDK